MSEPVEVTIKWVPIDGDELPPIGRTILVAVWDDVMYGRGSGTCDGNISEFMSADKFVIPGVTHWAECPVMPNGEGRPMLR